MNIRSMSVPLGFLLACAVWAAPGMAQQAAPPPGDWQKQLDALRVQVGVMQKDLDEIKALLAPLRTRPTPPENLVIDLGTRPVKGAATARLTLVELTDYQ
jgi:hypothetical protein